MKRILVLAILGISFTSVAQIKIDRSKAPAPSAAPEINIGESQSFMMDNGLKVFVVENHKLPRVSWQLSVNVDRSLEPGMVGLSEMAGDMLGAGTASRSKSEIDKAIDFVGGDLTTTSRGIFGGSLKKHSDVILDVMSDIVLNPAFPKDELEKKKKQALSGLKSVKTNPQAMLGRVKSALVYGKDHPMGQVQTAKDVESITVESCKSYYEAFFRPNVSYMVIVGDITLEEAKTKMTKYFGKWEKKVVNQRAYPLPAQPEGTRVAFIDKPGAVQSVINVTYPLDLSPGDDDEITAKVMNSILGGGVFSGRLMQNLREDKAFTYGARSSLISHKVCGNFTAFASVRNEVTDSAVNEFLVELRRMINEDVTEEELQLIKNSMSGQFALSLEKAQTVARFALNIEKYGLPKDYYASYLKKLEAITIADVRRVAKKYIRPENAWVVVVGNKEISENLARFAKSGEVEYYDLNGDVVELKEEKPLPEGVTGLSVIQSYLMKITQTESVASATKKVGKIKSRKFVATAEMQGMTLEFLTLYKAPELYFSSVSMGAMVVQKSGYDGSYGGEMNMQTGAKEWNADEIEENRKAAKIFKEAQFEKLGYSAELVALENVGDVECYKLKIKDADGNESEEYYSVESGFKVMEMSTEEGPTGPIVVTAEFSDFKEVDGFVYAHSITRTMGEQSFDMKLKSVEHNAKLKSTDFAVK